MLPIALSSFSTKNEFPKWLWPLPLSDSIYIKTQFWSETADPRGSILHLKCVWGGLKTKIWGRIWGASKFSKTVLRLCRDHRTAEMLESFVFILWPYKIFWKCNVMGNLEYSWLNFIPCKFRIKQNHYLNQSAKEMLTMNKVKQRGRLNS